MTFNLADALQVVLIASIASIVLCSGLYQSCREYPTRTKRGV